MRRSASRSIKLASSATIAGARLSASRTNTARAARFWVAPWLGVALLGCARSAVPSLSPESLTAPALTGLSPRVIDVRVVDQRPVPDEDRIATEQLVANVVGQVLATGGVAVDSDAAHRLFITVLQPLRRSDQIDPATCVEVQSELALWGGSSPAFGITRCATWRQGGAAFGSGLVAFESAVDHMLTRLDEQLALVLQRFAPPLFDAARIESPDFGWLQPREVALTVSDQVSADGSSGAGLERALESVFERLGIRRTQNAGYRVAWILGRPAPPHPGAASACVVLRVKVRDGKDTFHSGFQTCSGSNERVVSEILNALNTHGASQRRSAPSQRQRSKTQPLRTAVAVDRERLAHND